MKLKIVCLIALQTFLTINVAFASEWTLDDLIRSEEARDWVVSRDGLSASFVKSTVMTIKDEEHRVSNLWLARLDTEDTRALTRGKNEVSAPAFSPDGKTIAFISDRELPAGPGKIDDKKDEKQVWLISTSGGEAWPLTAFDEDVVAVEWRDGEKLIVLAAESTSAWKQHRDQIGDTTTIVDDTERQPFVRLYEVSLKDRAVRRLTENRNWINAVSVSPDGEWAVFTAQRSLSYQFDEKVTPGTYLLNLEKQAVDQIMDDRKLIPHAFRWFPDSSGFYFANNESDHPVYTAASVTYLYSYQVADGRFEKIDLEWGGGLAESFGAIEDGFIALLADGVRNRPVRYKKTRKGWRRKDLEGQRISNIDDLVVSLNGRSMVFTHSSVTMPPQVFVARVNDSRLMEERQLTQLNPSFDDKDTGRMELVQWQGARGDSVDGIVHFPLDWQQGQRYPLVLDIHGGPTSRDRDSWEQNWHDPGILYRQRGAFVLQMNYHGSTGYGLEWVTSISDGLYYELAYEDIEAGVDYLIGRGLVDAEKLGTAGWSNGGILSAELITRSGRYKAASIGAADVEWFSDWANVDFGAAFDNYYLGASPFENPQIYFELSPFFKLPEVTTPTLIITGTADRNVPPHQSWSLFRALQQTTDTPTRLVLFPGEPHSIGKPAHQRRKLEEEMAWMDRYLFGRPQADHSWLKDDSPLAALLQRSALEQAGGRYGVDYQGLLIPEVVSHAGLQLGRFEVTRAQYQQFDSNYPVGSGEEDLPASGLSFEQAKGYAQWLAGLTGKPFRLPTVSEARQILHGLKKSQGNTLSYWAGYLPNPEDSSDIRHALVITGQAAPLLKPVGSFAGQGETPIFDLDGNVAEWVDDGDKGLVFGPSADRADDARNTATVAAPAYRGLRILLESSTLSAAQ
jgi:dipeptidyl aminopeptidase/acylaminoacyl peptidase